MVLWHLSQQIWLSVYFLRRNLLLTSEMLCAQVLPSFIVRKTSHAGCFYCFSFSGQQAFIKNGLTFTSIPDSYVMYIKCDWFICQLIWFINLGSQSVVFLHGNTWLAKEGAWFLFIKGDVGSNEDTACSLFLIEKKDIWLDCKCI